MSSSSASASTPAPCSGSFVFAGVQLRAGADKQANVDAACAAVRAVVAERGAQVVSLPECFNSPYATSSFPEYAEPVALDDERATTTRTLAALAKELRIFLIGGSIPERVVVDADASADAADAPKKCERIYNTCAVFSPDGALLARHRKVHLFDISIPDKITFRESDTLTAGDAATTFDTPWCRIGVAICYDIRFPELAATRVRRGASMLVFPGAFNTTTGPLHWTLLARARAVDAQAYVAVVSPARAATADGYQAYGHTSVVDPWGEVVASTEHEPTTVVTRVELERVVAMRAQIPRLLQQRADVYDKPL